MRQIALRATLVLGSLGMLLTPPTSAVEQGDATRGQQLFVIQCAGCHALDPSQQRMGPPLAGVVGRKAGSVEGVRYSAAMRDAGFIWDEIRLEGYLANPGRYLPGTTKAVSVPNPKARADLIAYLRSLSKP